jgi:CMP-N,N'-diacetyllegionaminic acid synthase
MIEKNENKILAIVPARGGSKGVPRKNIRLLCGKPLIYYSIKAGLESKYVDRVVVSTEDSEIAEVAKKYNAEVIKRPLDLAKDDSRAFFTYKHILNFLKNHDEYYPDIIVILQPTSPLRIVEDVDIAVDLFMNNDCDSVIGVVEDNEVYWSFRVKGTFLNPVFGKEFLSMNRQDLPKLYRPNGAVFVTTPKNLLKNKGFHGGRVIPYVMPAERSVDIDTPIDFKLAHILLEKSE